eukprot:CAMPEP_0171634412 /NCGR_PEP_ID=MMETSP0990-20121206/25908_1 /TAXON_ID=483369 /ORGANISM="non described non described, Strain CCMP2098" /LENGTH=62 /DNA_ID=CAMNT_0012205565 /DNA_START=127 /DNA_END=312 /DNA_ORIENTATION=-
MVPALAVMEPCATIEVLKVTVDVLARPLTVKVPALAVIDPDITAEPLIVTLDVLAMPSTVMV